MFTQIVTKLFLNSVDKSCVFTYFVLLYAHKNTCLRMAIHHSAFLGHVKQIIKKTIEEGSATKTLSDGLRLLLSAY